MRDRANLAFLFSQLLRREITQRYRSTLLGGLWLILQPVLMLAIYTVVFSGIFKVRWSGAENSLTFALMLFAGLIVFNFFSDVLVSSPTLVSGNPNYVKKVVFPIEILAAVRVTAACVNALIGLLILFVARWWVIGGVSPWFAASLPVLMTMLPFLLGIAWLASSFGVYMPDIGQLAGLAASIMLFISPIFFPSSALPPSLSFVARVNPLAVPIEQLRQVAVQGLPPDGLALVVFFGLSCVFAAAALSLFKRLSPGFADVL